MIWRILSWLVIAATLALWISQLFLPDQGIGFVTGLVVFLITWWIVVFMILPIGIRSQQETGEMVQGTDPGAPSVANLKRKAWQTTVAASVIWLVLFVLIEFQPVRLDQIPFFPHYEDTSDI
ncbi:MAG: hypothetical protein CMF74_16535 [Maricaulis sp.]|jgi:predicted secreted protein|nr:hypothetical protein [Maricaulis sp.]HAQ33787.1 DUF1467 domain-containing protein [Alphaproteobacteria bacterium]|tara:strand:+ start:119 stop:484 length:366 start_codon:yes stop_codon:yes gene_type:complete